MSSPAAVEVAVMSDLDADEARALTEQIKTGMEQVWSLIIRAYVERAWAALDYTSWDDYCTREFGSGRLHIPREERAEVVGSMREHGMSVRAISAGTGLSRGTVQRQLSGVPNGTPDPETCDGEVAAAAAPPARTPGDITASTPGQTSRVDAALARARRAMSPDPSIVEPEPAKITGRDGKSHPSTKPARQPRRSSLKEDALKLALELNRLNAKFRKLLEDDRFKKNREDIICQFRPYAAVGRELLARLDG